MIELFSRLYGPYPWEAAGGIVDYAPEVGYALETQTKANYSSSPGVGTVVHEISHEWFGNAVSLRQWRDIWLSGGSARWSEWIWTERTGGRTAQAAFDAAYATPAANTGFWNPPPAEPGDAASTEDFIALAEDVSERDLDDFFRIWLYTPGKPAPGSW